jgi:hypothetical protein
MNKYFTQAQLILAAKIAEKRGYNRQLNITMVKRHTKTTDLFPVSFSMLHEHAAGVRVDPHVRCIVQLNCMNQRITVQIDCDLALFNSLDSDDPQQESQQSAHQDEEDAAYNAATR